MKHYFLTTFILLFISTVASSQTSSTKYLKDPYSDKEVPLTKVSGQTFYKYCGENIVFPRKAKEEGISGTVYLSVRISIKGKIEEVALVRGTNILLDKEAARIVRNATFSGPATINGEPIPICFVFPLRFTMR